MKQFSPRAWRCFLYYQQLSEEYQVFSTCVEVFPYRQPNNRQSVCFLHVRGGVSRKPGPKKSRNKFSPRAWRCFCKMASTIDLVDVFSTCVEVFLLFLCPFLPLLRFLHVRGGVSGNFINSRIYPLFSPRAWRCFSESLRLAVVCHVFSTCVEVFLYVVARSAYVRCFLHVRGGVSW